nr:B12-binding domain-containing radical SAM protein [Tissierella sp.]
MKTILATLNSKYIHSNLAIRYLQRFVEDIETVDIFEFTINQSTDFISSELFKLDADIIGFSVYIWNIKETLKICEILKIVSPKTKIFLGGPEVSYDAGEAMKEYPYVDFILFGEGEESFREFVMMNKNKEKDYSQIKGLAYRQDEEILVNQDRPLMLHLNDVPSPYENMTDEFENKIVYYESSRGCPFGCKFCLSSTIRGVRFFDIERVKRDLKNLIAMKVRQVKFVDRTFNANKKYSREIMEFLIEQDPIGINFHFEVTAHLIDDETLEFLRGVKEGLFQFEIGVQSTNERTIEAVGRTTDFQLLSKVSRKIKSFNNIHQHLDLIAGLPYEDYDSFGNSFNEVYALKPEKLQLGFLKLLKGSELRLNEKLYGYKYIDEPPYEVLENNFIDYRDSLKLKEIEEMVEKYYNEGNFKNTLIFLINNYFDSPFEFYETLSSYWVENKFHTISHSRNKLYTILYDFIKKNKFRDSVTIYNLLKYDYIFNNKKTRLPFEFEDKAEDYEFNIHEVLKDQVILDNYLSRHKDLPTKKLINLVNVVAFSVDVLDLIRNDYKTRDGLKENYILFDYRDGTIIECKTYDITQQVRGI